MLKCLKKRERGKNGQQGKMVQGYLTVEAAYIFVTALSVIVFVVSLGLFKYERCFFELESYYELQKSMQIGESNQEYINIENRSAILSRQKHMKLFGGIWGERKSVLQVEAKISQPDTVFVLRLKQRLMRTQEDEYRENGSTTTEVSGQ